ncbi:hypothetical protein DVH24_003911 [Malus domestica]|uniref:Uncharacterized protein n=1 Tax=Malus domestica TaxID=3750 RepID=A0A498K4T3_MALDO|nr:hypothetical protein DVH24_003911 [Malus domestica]
MMDHVEDQCEKYHGRQNDDYVKPYGRWFQDDVLGKDYRKPVGKRFGLGPEGGWSMSVPVVQDMDESMQEGRQLRQDIPDLNANLMEEMDGMAILPYMAPVSENVLSPSQPLMLFGTEIMASSSGPRNEEGKVIEQTSYENLSETTLSLGSDPFNLDAFIFGTGSSDGRKIHKRLGRIKGKMRMQCGRLVFPELGKQVHRDKDDGVRSNVIKKRAYSNSMIDAAMEVDEVLPRRV